MYRSLKSLDSKNKYFKDLAVFPGFNILDKPVNIKDNLNINNHVVLGPDKVIDEKIYINFIGVVNKNHDKTTRKSAKPEQKQKKQTKKAKPKPKPNKEKKPEKKKKKVDKN